MNILTYDICFLLIGFSSIISIIILRNKTQTVGVKNKEKIALPIIFITIIYISLWSIGLVRDKSEDYSYKLLDDELIYIDKNGDKLSIVAKNNNIIQDNIIYKYKGKIKYLNDKTNNVKIVAKIQNQDYRINYFFKNNEKTKQQILYDIIIYNSELQ